MSKFIKYGFLTFFLGVLAVGLGSQTYAIDIYTINTQGTYPRAIPMGYGNITNSITTCSSEGCLLGGTWSYQQLFSNMCYSWYGNDNYFYTTPTIDGTNVGSNGKTINTSACQSPITIGSYYGSPSWETWNEFGIHFYYASNNHFNVPGVSFNFNGEGIDFGFIRGSEGKIVYSQPSRAGRTITYQGNTYTITKVFFYPNRFIFSTSDGSFMYEIGAAGYVGDGFFVVNPNYTSNNLYFVQPSVLKAWSTTISSTEAWNLLLGNEAYSYKSDYNWSSSYTLTTVAGGSIFPSGFGNSNQDSSFGFSYTPDLEYESPNWGNSGSGSGSGSSENIQQEYLTCVGKYGYVSQLAQELQNLKNGIGVDYDYTGYLNIYEWAASFDGSYTGLNVQINNYSLDKTFVASVNHVWEISQASPHTYVYYFNQAVANITNPSNIISVYCGNNPLPNSSNMAFFDDPFGDNDGTGSNMGSGGCDWYDVGCLVGTLNNNLLDNSFDKVVGYLKILFNKIISPVVDSFNDGLSNTVGDRLSCGNNGFHLTVIDYVQVLLLFFIILFLLRLL